MGDIDLLKMANHRQMALSYPPGVPPDGNQLRVVFTGSRHWTDTHQVVGCLNQIRELTPHVQIGFGDCPTGLDAIVKSVKDRYEFR